MTTQFRGISMLMLTSLIWGTAFVAQSVGMDYVGPFTFNGVRFWIGALVLLPWIFYSSGKQTDAPLIPDKKNLKLLLQGGFWCGFLIFIGASLQQVGIIYTTVGKAGFLSALYIVIIPVLELFLGKKSSLLIWICIAIAIIGMYLLCIHESLSINYGDFLMILCSFALAFHILTVGHYTLLLDGVKLSFVQFFFCGLFSLICAFLFESPQWSLILAGKIPILYAGVLSCGIAYTLQVVGQKYVPPVIASLIFSLESVFAVLAGWFFLGELLTPREIIGCILILFAILLAQLPNSSQTKKTPS